MRLTPGSALALMALVMMLGSTVLSSSASSATAKKGSSCARPWVVYYNQPGKDRGLNSGDLTRIKLRVTKEPDNESQFNFGRVSWEVKNPAWRICRSLAEIIPGQRVLGCAKQRSNSTKISTVSATYYGDDGWKIPGPANGMCRVRATAGSGEPFTVIKVTAARR